LKSEEVTLAHAKRVIEEISESSELDYMQQITLDYISKFVKIDFKSAEDLLGKLIKEFNLERHVAVQIVNILPKTIEELRAITQQSRRVKEDDLSKILQKVLEVISA
jgi:DNA-directed RNA polymerase subunit F